jgi:hypothetical protein
MTPWQEWTGALKDLIADAKTALTTRELEAFGQQVCSEGVQLLRQARNQEAEAA